MPRHLLNTRPLEDAAALTALLEDRGHTVTPAPLLSIHHLAPDDFSLEGISAIVATSANGVRAFTSASARRDLRLYAVGDATARCAAEAGFKDVQSAAGDVDTLAALIIDRHDPATGILLHAAGTRVAGDLGGQLATAGLTVRRAVLYLADKAEVLPDAALGALQAGEIDGIVFFSPRTAASFATLVHDAGLENQLAGTDVFCLSSAVADKVRALEWRNVLVAARPDQDAMLTLIDNTPI